MSRPVDKSYYQGIGVAMVNTYTQGHVEDAKKKALNDLTSEISVTVKSTTLMQQVETNSELNDMYQNLTKVSTENDIEGYELVDSWGDEKEYWVYYRLSKSLYKANKMRKLDRAKNVASQFYNSGKQSLRNAEVGRAYQDFVKGLASLRDYIDAEITINTDKGEEYLVDALMSELIALNRELKILTSVKDLDVRIARPVEEEIETTVWYQSMAVSIPLKPYFSTGSGDVPNSFKTNVSGKGSFKIQKVTGGQNLQVLEVSPDIEGMTAEEEGMDLMSRLIRLKTGVPSAKINIKATKITAYFESDVQILGKKEQSSSIARNVKQKLSEEAYLFTDDKDKAEVIVKLTYVGKQGEEFPLKNKTLFTSFVDMYITVKDGSSGNEVFNKGFSDEKGSRAGGYDKAYSAAEEAALERFEKELMPEIGNLNL